MSMNILDKIVAVKKEEVEAAKRKTGLSTLESMPTFQRPVNSVTANYRSGNTTGIITEFKKASPSKGVINNRSAVEDVVKGYARHGAAAISVLTDESFFQGSLDDLRRARKAVPDTPLLRKDFMIDEYQIAEARVAGADLILLIAACLSPQRVQELAQYARSIGLEILLEIHNEHELVHICEEVDLVGVNNRDLKSFLVDVETSVRLAPQIPGDKIRVSESGIHSVATIDYLRKAGYEGFLIGENFMKEEDPGEAFARFALSMKSHRSAD